MSGLSSPPYLTCVKSNWPISNLRSESEHKYSNRTRTIAGSPLSRPPPSYPKANLGITHTVSLFAGHFDFIFEYFVPTQMYVVDDRCTMRRKIINK